MKRIDVLYQEMADHTQPECRSCRVPYSCCDAMYCDMADEEAKRQGITLVATGHPTLKFMDDDGCSVPPELRKLCTLHTCDINSFGVKPNDEKWTKRYFEIRDEIERLEFQEYLRRTKEDHATKAKTGNIRRGAADA